MLLESGQTLSCVHHTADPKPITSFALHSTFSSRNDLLTKTIVTKDSPTDQTNGRPQPTPNPTFSGNTIINTVDMIAIMSIPIPQPQVKTNIIRLNRGLTSYLSITCLRYWTPPCPSMAPASSMKATRAGRQGVPFSDEDILNGSGFLSCVRMAEPQKRNSM